MKKNAFPSTLWLFMLIGLICSAQFFVSCKSDTPDPNPGTSTTNPGSGTTTTPGSGTTTTPGSATTTTPGSGTTSGSVVSVTGTVGRTSNLSLLAAAIARAGIGSEVDKGELTLFAPSDDAFKAAGYANTDAINAAPAADLQRILRYHVIASRIDAAAFPTNVNTSYQTTLADGRVVVFKASDNTITVNNAKITQANIAATGSVVHIIDHVLVPPTVTVADLAKSNADLSLFAAAVNRAGTAVQTVATTNTATGVTIFAPNNAAFKAAGYADEAAINAADPKVLANLLSYHVLNYRAYQQTFQNGSDVVTAQGGSLHFNVSGGKVTIQGKGNGTNVANITQGDLATTNGVVHIIDRVLLP